MSHLFSQDIKSNYLNNTKIVQKFWHQSINAATVKISELYINK